MPSATTIWAATSRATSPTTRATRSCSVLRPIDEHKPVTLIVGGEPLVRFRELNTAADPGRPRLHTRASAVRPSRSSGPGCRACRSSSRSTACSPSTTSVASRRPTTASSSTSPGSRSPCTARSRGSRSSVRGISRSSCKCWSTNADTRQIWVSLYTPDRRNGAGDPDAGRSRPGRPGSAPAADDVSEAQDAQGHDRGLRQAAGVAGGVRVRPRPPCPPTWNAASPPASSAATPTARNAGASPAPASRPSPATSFRGGYRSGHLLVVAAGQEVGRPRPRRHGRVADRPDGRTEGLSRPRPTARRVRAAKPACYTRPDVHEPVSPPEPPGFAPAPPAKCGRCGSSRSG